MPEMQMVPPVFPKAEQQETLEDWVEEEEGDYTLSPLETIHQLRYVVPEELIHDFSDDAEEEEESFYATSLSTREMPAGNAQSTVVPDTISLREEVGYVATIIKDFVKELPTIYKDPLKEPLPGGSPSCAMAQNYMQAIKQKMLLLGLQEAKRHQYYYSLS